MADSQTSGAAATVRVAVQPGRVHYRPGSVHAFQAGDEFDLPASELAVLEQLGHVARVEPPAAPMPPAPSPG